MEFPKTYLEQVQNMDDLLREHGISEIREISSEAELVSATLMNPFGQGIRSCNSRGSDEEAGDRLWSPNS
jgi:hypothetical protein